MPRTYPSPPHLSGPEPEQVNDAFASNWTAPLGLLLGAVERELTTAVVQGQCRRCANPAAAAGAAPPNRISRGQRPGGHPPVRGAAPCHSAGRGRAWMLAANGMTSRPA